MSEERIVHLSNDQLLSAVSLYVGHKDLVPNGQYSITVEIIRDDAGNIEGLKAVFKGVKKP